MIDMRINDYLLKSNQYGVNVEKLIRNKSGEVSRVVNNGVEKSSTSSIGSYPNLRQALAGVRKHMIYTGPQRIRSFDELRIAEQNIQSEFDQYLEKVPNV